MGRRELAAIGAIMGLAWMAPTSALAACKMIEIAEFHVDPKSRTPIVDGEIDGKPVKVMFDTGGFSLIPRHEADRLGLVLTPTNAKVFGIGGESDLYSTQLKQLKIGKFVVPGMQLPVAGDEDVAWTASLVLGDDFFSQVDAEFDLPDNAVRLFKPQGCAPAQLIYWGAAYSQAPLLAWARDHAAIQTTALVNGKRVLAELDTGSPVTTMDATTAAAAGVEHIATGVAMQGSGHYARDSWVGRIATFALGDETVKNVHVQVADLRSDMSYAVTGSKLAQRLDDAPSLLVGADFFRAHRIYIDVRDHLILFSYSGGPVFQPEEAGPRPPASAAGAAPKQPAEAGGSH